MDDNLMKELPTLNELTLRRKDLSHFGNKYSLDQELLHDEI